MRQSVDTVIVGGGPAGLAAAIACYDAGQTDVVVLERDGHLGGILQQCIHNGFGLQWFQEELTGPEYAQRFVEEVEKRGIRCEVGTMVVEIVRETGAEYDKSVRCLSGTLGAVEFACHNVILSMGCRERVRGNLKIPGTRPVGIYSAGLAQRLVNLEGVMPGRSVVVLGSGDIGLIMARRMKWEGADVKMVCELMPYSAGLARNIQQCLVDLGIPLRLSTTVVQIHGKERLEGVTIAAVDEKRQVVAGTEEYVPCDTLLLSVGLLPENELSRALQLDMDPITGGPVVDEKRQTSLPGVYACGNVLHVHDIVDFVSKEGEIAGRAAAQRLQCIKAETSAPQSGEMLTYTEIRPQGEVRYTVPQKTSLREPFTIYFRVGRPLEDGRFVLKTEEGVVWSRHFVRVMPGEMQEIKVNKTLLDKLKWSQELVLEAEL